MFSYHDPILNIISTIPSSIFASIPVFWAAIFVQVSDIELPSIGLEPDRPLNRIEGLPQLKTEGTPIPG